MIPSNGISFVFNSTMIPPKSIISTVIYHNSKGYSCVVLKNIYFSLCAHSYHGNYRRLQWRGPKIKKKINTTIKNTSANKREREGNICEQSLFLLSALHFVGVNVQLVSYASRLGWRIELLFSLCLAKRNFVCINYWCNERLCECNAKYLNNYLSYA